MDANHCSGVAAGAVRETVIQSGLPPMAAMSERLTAAALWARSFVGTSGKKWVPATRVSVLTSSCEPTGGVRMAASSPTPRVTLGSPVKVKWRLMMSLSRVTGRGRALGPLVGAGFGGGFCRCGCRFPVGWGRLCRPVRAARRGRYRALPVRPVAALMAWENVGQSSVSAWAAAAVRSGDGVAARMRRASAVGGGRSAVRRFRQSMASCGKRMFSCSARVQPAAAGMPAVASAPSHWESSFSGRERTVFFLPVTEVGFVVTGGGFGEGVFVEVFGEGGQGVECAVDLRGVAVSGASEVVV